LFHRKTPRFQVGEGVGASLRLQSWQPQFLGPLCMAYAKEGMGSDEEVGRKDGGD
jgi:hypothetical protein